MDYSPPTKDELKNALTKRFVLQKSGKYSDVWACTFYENVYRFLRKPEGAYCPNEHPIAIQNRIFMNHIEKEFPDKFYENPQKLKVFGECFLTEFELNKLVDIMYKLYNNEVAQYISWERICRFN